MMPAVNEGVQVILQESLTQAFSFPPSSIGPTSEDTASSSSKSAVIVTPTESADEHSSATPETSDESWKIEYQAQLAAWRAQSAEGREKAEQERERWVARRAAEKEEAARRVAMGIVDEPTLEHSQQEIGWETVSNKNTQPVPASFVVSEAVSPRAVIARNLSTDPLGTEVPVPLANTSALTETSRSHSRPGDELQKWEDLHSSVTSSFPSMSYPEHMQTPSPSRQPHPPPAPLNTTLAIFDSTLPTRTRVKAFFSSLAINMLLPFVNGVMLGFGEIFAKNVVLGWFGWNPQGAGSVAATAGIGASSRKPWRQRQTPKES